MAPSHYFSSPQGSFEPRALQVELAERRLSLSTAGGIFSPDGVDKGTQVLLRGAPDPAQQGNLLDVGCGWGPIALTMAMLSPQATVWAVDVNERARTLCAQNASAAGLTNIEVRAPEDVPTDLGFSTIWSNPPIRVGKAVLHQILRTWLPLLDAEGEAWLVVQKNLGADSLQKWLSAELGAEYSVDRPQTSKGFRLLRVVRR
ncbi:MAG: class I SAM-dependent methyltransferase [Nesterenkonia sp.]